MAAEAVASDSARKDWNLTTSAPACAAASTRRRAVSSEPLWLTPASAITSARRASAMIEKPLLHQAPRIVQPAQPRDDALGAATIAVGIDDLGAVERYRASDRLLDSLLLRLA